MECTAADEYGSFDCTHCLVEALIRCKRQNERAYKLWGMQLKRERPDQYERARLILRSEK